MRKWEFGSGNSEVGSWNAEVGMGKWEVESRTRRRPKRTGLCRGTDAEVGKWELYDCGFWIDR
jgi:hypothetical protein